ncbi:MAG: tetratricopeptide repeat protein [Myxococcota bacterium]
MNSSGFSAGEAARLSKLTERRVLAFAEAGIVGRRSLPGPKSTRARKTSFDFRDVALLKTAARLIAHGVPPSKVRKTFAALRNQLPRSKSLSSARLEAQGRTLIAHDAGTAWEPESGQILLTFEAPSAAEVIERELASAPDLGLSESMMAALDDLGNLDAADYWFDLAMSKEDEAPQDAYDHYIRALACNPEHLEATINIGRLCSSGGDLSRAAAYFRQAVRLDPSHPVAQFNLAVTMHDLDEQEAATAAYRAALKADPNFADAHFNLAALLEQQGDRTGAIHHLKAYDRCRENESER